jgi:hypothetical protein
MVDGGYFLFMEPCPHEVHGCRGVKRPNEKASDQCDSSGGMGTKKADARGDQKKERSQQRNQFEGIQRHSIHGQSEQSVDVKASNYARDEIEAKRKHVEKSTA